MIPGRPSSTARVRRGLRRLPMLETNPDDVQAIFDATVDRTSDAPPAPDTTPGPRWRLAHTAAIAATIALAAAGLWAWTLSHGEEFSERELARLDAEVEVALVRIGQVLHETERIALHDVLGADAVN